MASVATAPTIAEQTTRFKSSKGTTSSPTDMNSIYRARIYCKLNKRYKLSVATSRTVVRRNALRRRMGATKARGGRVDFDDVALFVGRFVLLFIIWFNVFMAAGMIYICFFQ